jgi:hypothetical protein
MLVFYAGFSPTPSGASRIILLVKSKSRHGVFAILLILGIVSLGVLLVNDNLSRFLEPAAAHLLEFYVMISIIALAVAFLGHLYELAWEMGTAALTALRNIRRK